MGARNHVHANFIDLEKSDILDAIHKDQRSDSNKCPGNVIFFINLQTCFNIWKHIFIMCMILTIQWKPVLVHAPRNI
jgi:hypothetical protein